MDALHELIGSLSKGEKKMIRVKAARNQKNGRSQYLELFDIYEQLDSFDKNIVKRKAEAVGITQLAVLKMRLYHFVLGAIRQVYADKRKIYEVRELVDYADILVEKNLFKASKKMLLKAQKYAEQYDFIHEYLVINEKLKSISVLANDLSEINLHIEEKKSLRLIDELKIIQEYDELIYESKHNMIQNFRYGVEYDDSTVAGIKKRLKQIEKQPTNLNLVKRRADEIWSFIYLAENNFEKSIYHRRKVLADINASKQKIQDDPIDWLYHMKMLIATLSVANMKAELDKEMESFDQVLKTLKFSNSNARLTQVIKSTVYMIKLNHFISNNRFEEGSKYLEEVFESFKSGFGRLDLNNQQVLIYNIMLIYFGNREFRKALRWINELINSDFQNTRLDV